MGLDAYVHCDCFERGRLLVPPQPEWEVYVDECGARQTRSADLDMQIEFDVWNMQDACEHRNGMLVHHFLGNIALVALLRTILQPSGADLPVILKKVIHNGIHCGDELSITEVHLLLGETKLLHEIHDIDPRSEQFLRDFEKQLCDLVTASLSFKRPIVF